MDRPMERERDRDRSRAPPQGSCPMRCPRRMRSLSNGSCGERSETKGMDGGETQRIDVPRRYKGRDRTKVAFPLWGRTARVVASTVHRWCGVASDGCKTTSRPIGTGGDAWACNQGQPGCHPNRTRSTIQRTERRRTKKDPSPRPGPWSHFQTSRDAPTTLEMRSYPKPIRRTDGNVQAHPLDGFPRETKEEKPAVAWENKHPTSDKTNELGRMNNESTRWRMQDGVGSVDDLGQEIAMRRDPFGRFVRSSTTSLSLQRFFFHPPARPPSNFIVRSVCEDVSSATHVPFLHLVRGGGFTTSRLLRTFGFHTQSRCLLHAPLAVGVAMVSSSSWVRSCLVPPWEPSVRPVWDTTPGRPIQCFLWGRGYTNVV